MAACVRSGMREAVSELPFMDLERQRQRLGPAIERAMARVVAHGQFILGPEVAELEGRLSALSGAAHAVTCGNGTDALALVLMAEGIGPGDAVFVPAFTFVATAEAVAQVGATPYFVDVEDDSFNLDPTSLSDAVPAARRAGLRPRAVIAVDLFGTPADYDRLRAVASAERLLLVADAAQAFGASQRGRPVGRLADYTTTSFFPAKPLGCYGDGGAIFTEDGARAALLRSLRAHGRGDQKYDSQRIGLNSRLDSLQAAVLLEKLAIFEDEINRRTAVAARYDAALAPLVAVPNVPAAGRSVWAHYTIRSVDRDRLSRRLRERGIPTRVYYPVPLHRQAGYRHFPHVPQGLSVAEALSATVLSLPMHPYLEAEAQDRIIACIEDALTVASATA